MKLVAVSKNTHGQKVWRRPANYQFAAKDAVTPIVLAEVVHVGAWMPIVFMEQAGRYVPMAMMSPMPGTICSSGRTASGWEAICRRR